MKNYICSGNKYIFNKGYIGLPIVIGNLPQEISIQGEELHLKSSFQVSLLCVKDIVEKYGESIENLEQKILEYFCKFTSGNDVSFLWYKGDFRLAQFEKRKSVIAMCEVSNLETFSKFLSVELGIEIPIQPTHVTLYTLQPDVGIGLNSSFELETKSTPIQVTEELRKTLEIG